MKRSSVLAEGRVALLFHLPSIVVLFLITMIPLAYNVYLSLFNYRISVPGSIHDFIALENYGRLLADGAFWRSVGITLIFVVASTLLELVLGAAIALLLERTSVGKKLLTSLWMVPMTVAPLVVGLMFSFILNPQFGLYGYFLDLVGSKLSRAPLSSSFSAFAALILIDVWEWTPYMVLMIFAGFKTLPLEPYEAADLDGAGDWQKLRFITWPLMKPIVAVSVILRAVEAIKVFDQPYLLTGGGPGAATEVVDLYTYRQAFVNFNFSYASALCFILFLILLGIGILYWFMFIRKEAAS